MSEIQALLEISQARHSHLCPRQVLGVRLGMIGAAALGLALPRADKRLLVILETDGCFADGIEAATGCSVGHRTLRIEDYGKVAATFVDTLSGQAARVTPRAGVRQRAYAYALGERRHYFAQLAAYQVMPDEELAAVQAVRLTRPVTEIISRAGVRVDCALCGEEIINERETVINGQAFCQSCAFGGYYHLEETPAALPLPQDVFAA